jgi:hypothetical protein
VIELGLEEERDLIDQQEQEKLSKWGGYSSIGGGEIEASTILCMGL